MTRVIEISVRDRIAWQTNKEEYICGNSDFVVDFVFDAEWESIETKTARFVYGNQHKDVVFDGNRCEIPKILDARKIKVGVFAGNLKTTTPAKVPCKRSILCDAGLPADPTHDVYAQIIEKLDHVGGADAVKTVNGIAPDENGNVEIVVDGGFGESSYSNFYNVKNYGAVGDGVTDDVTAIQAAVTAAYEAGGGTVYIPQGEYVVKSPILWESGVSLVGDGIGRSIIKSVSDEAVLGFSAIHYDTTKYGTTNRIKNCTFTDFEIDGSGLRVSVVSWRGKGIFLIGVEDCIFRDICIRETAATGLGIDALKNVTISGVMCINCGRTWVKPTSEANLGCAGIGIGTNMIADEYFTITGCMTKACGNMGIFLEDQSASGSLTAQYSVVSNNIVLDGMNVGIGVRGTQCMLISDNIISGNVYGIEFSRCNKNIKITNNLISENQYGIYDNSISDDAVDISGNTICDNAVAGILYIDTTTLGTGTKKNVMLKDNHVKNNTTGISITGEISEIAIVGNLIERNTNFGMFAASGTNLLDGYVLQNTMRKNGNDHNGVVGALSGDYRHDIAVATLTGISMSKTTANVIVGNSVSLDVSPIPADAELTEAVTWTSDNNSVATVTNGVVSGVANGDCIITAKSGEFTAECSVSVSEAPEVTTVAFTTDDVQNGYYSDTGEFVEVSGHETSNKFISLENVSLVTSNKNVLIVLFDENKNFLSKILKASCFVVPNGAKYFKVKVATSDTSLTSVVLTVYPTGTITNEFTATSVSDIYINASGADTSSTDIATTDQKIPVVGASSYAIAVNSPLDSLKNIRYAEYDENNVFIARYIDLAASGTTAQISSNCRYIRVSYVNAGSNKQFTDDEKTVLLANTVVYQIN